MSAPSVDPQVLVVIVTYNSLDVIDNCLNPLEIGSDPAFHVVVHDNASTDGTPELIANRYPSVTLLRSSENVGFAKGVNNAVKGFDPDVICLLNPDAIVSKTAVLELARKTRGRVGVVAPLISHPGRLRIVPAGHFPTLWRMFTHYSGLSRLAGRRSLLQGHYLLPRQVRQGAQRVDWVTGACMSISRACWQDLQGLSEKWFMYAEDVEFCFRAHEQGFEVHLDSTITGSHAVGGSTAGNTSSMNPAWILNLFDFYRDGYNPSRLTRFLWKKVVALGLVSRAMMFTWKATRSPDERATELNHESRRFRSWAKSISEF